MENITVGTNNTDTDVGALYPPRAIPDKIERATFGSMQAYFRPGTSDENVLKEVLVARTYSKTSVGFDVEAGEHWLDLGANIGAFALYCQSKGATAECYEPMPDCFALLRKNAPKFDCYQSAISNLQAPEVTFWTSRNESNHYRGTLIARKGYPQVRVKNTHASALCGRKFDGIKADIEGSEFGLIDEWLLPEAKKLVLEYHTSRDNSLANLARRVQVLKRHYPARCLLPRTRTSRRPWHRHRQDVFRSLHLLLVSEALMK